MTMTMAPKKVGAKYIVTGNGECPHEFELGDVVRFVHDDGSDAPRFERLSDGKRQYLHLGEVRLKRTSNSLFNEAQNIAKSVTSDLLGIPQKHVHAGMELYRASYRAARMAQDKEP